MGTDNGDEDEATEELEQEAEEAEEGVTHDLAGPFFEDILRGNGLHPSIVHSAFSELNERDLSLHDRIRDVRNKLETKRSTTMQYLRLKNLFMVKQAFSMSFQSAISSRFGCTLSVRPSSRNAAFLRQRTKCTGEHATDP